MTITSGSPRSTRRARSTGPDAGSAKSSAALRAYERRQQRAVALAPDAGPGARATARPSVSTAAITARIPFVALIIGLLSLGMGLTLLLTTRSAEDSYVLSDAKAQNERLVQERASLQRDVELADSAPELARKAAEQGMVPAANAARLLVAADGSVQVVGTPEPAQGTPVAPLDPPESDATSTSTRSGLTLRTGGAPLGADRAVSERSTATTPVVPGRPTNVAPRATVPPVTPTTPNVVSPPPATPNVPNDARTEALGEQLVPMSIPSASPAGSGQ
ncbi:MAG: hypothetical protein WBQ44_12200 [Rhodococcus sp. (in: high G+C Gram-positive bacteria)]